MRTRPLAPAGHHHVCQRAGVEVEPCIGGVCCRGSHLLGTYRAKSARERVQGQAEQIDAGHHAPASR